MNYLAIGTLVFFSLISLTLLYLYQQEKRKKANLQEAFNHLQNTYLANRRITYELAILKEVIQNLSVQQNLDSLSQNLLKSLQHTLPVSLVSFLLLTDLEEQNSLYSSMALKEEQQQIILEKFLPLQNQIVFYKPQENLPAVFKSLNLTRGISLPLERQDKVFGNLILAVAEPYHFSQEDLRLFTTITQQTALAVENLLLARQQLAQAKHLASLGEVTAGIAHEIKNPLAIIRGFAECLPLDLDSPEEISHSSQLIIQEVDRLTKIIGEVLHFARPPQPELLPSDLNNCLERTLELVEGQIAKKAVQLEVFLTPNLPKVSLDEEQIRQVFLNLILNALEAMPEGGKLEIKSFSLSPYQVGVLFQDTGCGISPENLQHIFRPFFSSKKKGTGLGLAITSRIIENHRGKIQVESKLGEGSTFYLCFPVSKED